MSNTTSQSMWLRYLSFVVASQDGTIGKELVAPASPGGDALHVVFTITHSVMSTPSTLSARVYNVSPTTAAFLLQYGKTPTLSGGSNAITPSVNSDPLKTNGQVVLSAGYQNNHGLIYKGLIRQVRWGRVNATDTYIDIFAVANDWLYNWGIANATLAAGYSQQDVVNSVIASVGGYGATLTANVAVPHGTSPANVPPTNSPRGKAIYGMARDVLRDVAAAHQNTWRVDDNSGVHYLPWNAYINLPAVVLNSATGMINIPEQTAGGIRVRSLLNPQIGVGRRLQINNRDIQDAQVDTSIVGYSKNTLPPLSSVSPYYDTGADGFYKVVYVDHIGDNRGQNWYSDMTCVTIDQTYAGGPTFQGNIPTEAGPTGIPP